MSRHRRTAVRKPGAGAAGGLAAQPAQLAARRVPPSSPGRDRLPAPARPPAKSPARRKGAHRRPGPPVSWAGALTRLLVIPAVGLLLLLLLGDENGAGHGGTSALAAPSGAVSSPSGQASQPGDGVGSEIPFTLTPVTPADTLPVATPGDAVTLAGSPAAPTAAFTPAANRPPASAPPAVALVPLAPASTSQPDGIATSTGSADAPALTLRASPLVTSPPALLPATSAPAPAPTPTPTPTPTPSPAPTSPPSESASPSGYPTPTLIPNVTCATITLSASSLSATIDESTGHRILTVTDSYTGPATGGTAATVIHTDVYSSDAGGAPLQQSNTTVPTQPGSEPATLATVDLDLLTAPVPDSLVLTLTTTPPRCAAVTLASITIIQLATLDTGGSATPSESPWTTPGP